VFFFYIIAEVMSLMTRLRRIAYALKGSNLFLRDGGKIIKVNTLRPTMLYVPISYFEAHVEHFWSTIKSIFEAYLDHK
jgi:hypothetical protein